MKNSMKCVLAVGFLAALFVGSCSDSDDIPYLRPGLVGAYYGNADLTNIKEPEILYALDQYWDEETGHGSSWSGHWEGMLTAPVTGVVTFYLETNKEARLQIAHMVLDADSTQPQAMTDVAMTLGETYGISLIYKHSTRTPGKLKVSWSWLGRDTEIIPGTAFGFTSQQGDRWNWLAEPDPAHVDYDKFYKAKSEHIIVCYEKDMFGGWPANNGIWSWGDEILVGFTQGHYLENPIHHSIDGSKPSRSMLARSLDGGETWMVEDPQTYPGDGKTPLTPKDRIDFSHPDLAIRCTPKAFFVSYDRGRSWEGPYPFPGFGQEKLTNRTDYIPIDKDRCLFFLSAEDKTIEARLQDRAFCAIARDGGRQIEFRSWICPIEDTYRSVMPSSVRLEDGTIVTALRRRHDQSFGDEKPRLAKNWIDVYVSRDEGATWQFLSKMADTDMGKHNGNPPRLILLNDGRLCVTYGYRAVPFGIRAKLSSDQGRTWGPEIHLRDHAREFDFGYTRSVQRPDGRVVTVYYFTTDQNYEQHIAATIWDPDTIIEPR